MLNYTGIPEHVLVHGLYHATPSLPMDRPAGMIDRMYGGSRVEIETVYNDLAQFRVINGKIYIDYYRGRPLKVILDIIKQEFDEHFYDRDAGAGSAQRVIDSLRAEL